MRMLLVVVLTLAGCGSAVRLGGLREIARPDPPSTDDVIAISVSTAAIAEDWRQTHRMASLGWNGHRIGETGYASRAIGVHPTSNAVDAYFASTLLANAAIWYLLPSHWRNIIPGFVIGVQASIIAGNAQLTGL